MAWREDAHINKLRVGSPSHPVNANRLPADASTVVTDGVWGAQMTVGTEAGNAITVTVQLMNAHGRDVSGNHAVQFYVSDDASGNSLAATAPTTLAAGTDGLMIENIANKAGMLVSESDGDIDVAFGEAGVDTWYLCLVIPATGEVVVSGAVTFA